MRRWVLAALWVAGCAGPAPRTQVMLQIDLDPEVREASEQLFVEVFGGARDEPVDTYPSRYVRTFELDSLRLPFRVALAPLDPEPPRGWVAVVAAQRADGADVAATTIRGGYADGRTVRVEVRLTGDCIGVPCDGLRCLEGRCVDPAVDVSTAPPFAE